MSGSGLSAAFPSRVSSCGRSGPASAKADEYLGADGAGSEYFTRGGHVYSVPSDGTGSGQQGAPCPRGRFAAFNRLSRRHRRKK